MIGRAMKARLLIVGGGIMGLAAAWRCARRGRGAVLLLERKTFGAGSSGRSGAILRTHYKDRELVRIARDSLVEYAGFEGRNGTSIGFHRCGVVTLAGPGQAQWQERVRENVATMRELGVEVELVDAARLRALFPGAVVREGSLASFEPQAGFVDPALALAGFAARARKRGAELREGVEVQELRIERGRVVGAKTSAGEVACEQLLVVAGPWTRALLARHGLEFPLKVVRPENIYLGVPELGSVPGSARTLRGGHPVLIDLELGCYARCEPDQHRTRAGRVDYDVDHVLDDPDTLDEEVGPEMKTWARATLAARMPSYTHRPDAGALAAWYTLTPDAQALIGPVRGVEGLWIASGFSGHGFKLAPSIGEGLAQMLHGEPVTAFDPAFFAPERFAGRAEWGGRFGL